MHGAPVICIGDVELETASTAKLLGVMLDEGLCWTEQLVALESKLSKGIFVIRSLSAFKNLKLLKNVYHCLVESHISYSIALWEAKESALSKIFIL
ncbi:hypothetical protein J6590_085389 [Homalodisca vitripennis]|nr:hypothetical protein J6590_085389 [Homalodisca vitripennis]